LINKLEAVLWKAEAALKQRQI